MSKRKVTTIPFIPKLEHLRKVGVTTDQNYRDY